MISAGYIFLTVLITGIATYIGALWVIDMRAQRKFRRSIGRELLPAAQEVSKEASGHGDTEDENHFEVAPMKKPNRFEQAATNLLMEIEFGGNEARFHALVTLQCRQYAALRRLVEKQEVYSTGDGESWRPIDKDALLAAMDQWRKGDRQ